MFSFYHYSRSCAVEPEMHEAESALARELKKHVQALSQQIGERNYRKPRALARARDYVAETWRGSDLAVGRQDYEAEGQVFSNLWVEIPGRGAAESIVVVGAHYDSVIGTPGADDNGTAVAGLLSLSMRARQWEPDKTLRFVAFANEEPPFFMTYDMGSVRYVEKCHSEGDQIIGMVCLEMLGYFSDEPGSQRQTLGVLPDRGNFIALVGNPESTELVQRSAAAFEATVDFPFEAATPPTDLISYAGFSDHWSFWQAGWPAFMVTDTGPLRNPHYHQATDLPHTIDYVGFTRVVRGVEGMVRDLVT